MTRRGPSRQNWADHGKATGHLKRVSRNRLESADQLRVQPGDLVVRIA